MFHPNSNLNAECSIESFEAVKDDYLARKEKIVEAFLFHKYAEAHPGMEHLAGVYKGGTFILVYVDLVDQENRDALIVETASMVNEIFAQQGLFLSQEEIESIRTGTGLFQLLGIISQRPNISPVIRAQAVGLVSQRLPSQLTSVIGDFSLPYTCCSDQPAFNYVIKRNPPVLLLTPNEFCVDDPNEYEFTVFPMGGQIFGPGTALRAVDMQPYFVPANAGIDPASLTAPQQIEVSYEVEGAISRMQITILPLPDAGFIVSSKVVCIGTIVSLTPNLEGGTFTAWSGADELAIFDTGNREIDTGSLEIPLDGSLEIRIRYEVTDEYNCINTSEQLLTVLGLPNPAFEILRNGEIVTEVCIDQEPVMLDAVNEGTYTFTVDGEPDSGVSMEGNQVFFGNLGIEGDSALLTITHVVVRPENETCMNQTTRQLVIRPLPNATFEMPIEGDLICVNQEPVAIQPVEAGGTFRVVLDDGNEIPGAVNAANEFDPSTVPFGEANERTIRIIHELGDAGGCSSSFQRQLIVRAAADSAFNIFDEEGNIVSEVCSDQGPLVLQPAVTPPGLFTALIGGTPQTGVITDDLQLIPAEVDLGGEVKVELTIQHIVTGQNLLCPSSSSQTLTVVARPDAAFEASVEVMGDGEIAVINLSEIQPEEVDKYQWRVVANGQPVLNTERTNNETFSLTVPIAELPEQGAMIVRMRAIRGNCTGEAQPATFTLPLTGEQPRPGEERNGLTEEELSFLNRRAAGQRTAVEELGSDRGLARTRAFGMTNSFMAFMGPVDALNDRFEETANALINNFIRARGARQAQYESLFTHLVHNYLDKQVAANREEMPDVTRGILRSIVEKAKNAGVKIAAVRSSWEGTALKNALNAPVVNKYTRILR